MYQSIKKYLIRYRWFRSLPINVNIKLRNIVYHDDVEGEWVARCLDLNLVATSTRKMDAAKELNSLIIAQIKFTADNDNWAYLFRPAAKQEWVRFEHFKRQCQHKRTKINTALPCTLDTCFA